MSRQAPKMEAIPSTQFYGGSAVPPPPPPQRTDTLQVPDTLIHDRLTSSFPYSSDGGQFRRPAFVAAAKELKGKYVRTTAEKFLKHYLPDHPAGMPEIEFKTFQKVALIKNEPKMYKPLIAALVPFLKAEWEMVDTSSTEDPLSGFFLSHKVKPDISVYSPDHPRSNDNPCRACDMETFIECKVHTPFEPFTDKKGSLERNAGDARESRGQLITYLNAVQAAQYRTHCFGVFILGATCRLLRHTHSGIEFTKSFDYTATGFLQTFFWRFSRATPECRGIDTTFERIGRYDQQVARHFLNAREKPFWKVKVGDRSFYVSEPFTRSHHYPIGRGTRCFVALECHTQQKCLLKDTWRLDGYHPEGETYAKLLESNVPNIAGVVAAGDVLDHRCGHFPKGWHTHYRIALDVVGNPLAEFPSTHSFVSYVYDVALAHRDAFTLAGVEHRDISLGNIVFVKLGDRPSSAILIDWELSKLITDKANRVSERTGTLQFKAARLCGPSPPPRTIGDDVESFVLLLLWMAARYAPNNMTSSERGNFLARFDRPNGLDKMDMIRLGADTVANLKLLSSELRKVLAHVMSKCLWRYKELSPLDEDDAEAAEELQRQKALVEGHDWLIDILSTALQNDAWKAGKDRSRPEQEVEIEIVEVERKRKSECSEYEQVLANKRPFGGERPGFVEEDDDEDDDDDDEDDDDDDDDE
ncbi:hypothetical protein BDZ89DRAFT_1071147 [Hymenopellis radicata]|nr:hypothetical protein BDZ89DRAFT_1071147 [Hymenopellis radicata]